MILVLAVLEHINTTSVYTSSRCFCIHSCSSGRTNAFKDPIYSTLSQHEFMSSDSFTCLICEKDDDKCFQNNLFLVRFGFQMGCTKEVSYRPTSLMCIWMTCLLSCCNTGSVSGDTIINHLMYADDLVLISSSATGMK